MARWLRRESHDQLPQWLRDEHTATTPKRRRTEPAGAQPHGAKRRRERTDRTGPRAPVKDEPPGEDDDRAQRPGREA